MNVAFCIRKGYDTQVGGDSIQLLKTKEYLERDYGLHIDVLTGADQLEKGYDLVHIFNLATREETAAFFDRAKQLQLKTALSTIFWDYSYQAAKDLAKLVNYNIFFIPGTMAFFLAVDDLLARAVQKPRVIAAPFKDFIRRCVAQADLLLPNSAEELEQLASFAALPLQGLWNKTTVVYNATDAVPKKESSAPQFFSKYALPQNYVLQVGRIEYIKNQLGTLLALYHQPQIPLVFVGRSNDDAYLDVVRKKAARRGNVYFIEQVPHAEIPEFFSNARLHVLPSLRESPGLVNLEALINGCPIVVSDSRFLPFNTYFTGMATAVDPLSVNSIRKGIFSEIKQQRDFAAIRSHIAANFSWQRAAQQTFSGYTRLLGR